MAADWAISGDAARGGTNDTGLADTCEVGGCGDTDSGDGIEADGCEITGPATGFMVVHLKPAKGAVFSTTLDASAKGAFGIAC